MHRGRLLGATKRRGQVQQSFDHLVGTGKHTRRYFQAECFGSLDVEHSFRISSEPAPGGRLVSRLSGCGRRRRRQADTRRPDQYRRRSIRFGDETAEVMGSNGAMIVPQDIKPKQTVRQGFRQCLTIALRSLPVASNCTGASDKVPMTAAWRASRRPGTGQQRRARRRGVQSLAQAYVFNVFGWLVEAARG